MRVLAGYRRFHGFGGGGAALCSDRSAGVDRIVRKLSLRLALPLALAAAVSAQDLKEFEKRVSAFTLANGLQFIVAERRDTPVVSFHTYVPTGSVEDPGGRTGLAHMIEHMAFKGTESIGTRDWAAEKKALDAIEEAHDRLEAERGKPQPDTGKVGAAQIAVNRAIAAAQTYVKPGEYRRILEENGAVNITAAVTFDSSEYSYSLPSNRLELWFLMESQRLQRPVFREFYREREAMLEEFKERIETNVQGRLQHALRATAMMAHPYRNPSLGWPGDIANLRMRDAREFFDRYYVPGNIKIAIAGDVDTAEVRRLAERYFGGMPARPLPPVAATAEPAQAGPKTVAVEGGVPPLLMVAYHRPDQYQDDDAVLDVLQFALAGSRSGLLFRTLVDEQKTSLGAQCLSTFPGGRYPSLFAILASTAPGRTLEDNQKAIEELIQRIVTEGIDQASLDRAKVQIRAGFLSRLDTNPGMAYLLAAHQGVYQDWRRMFASLETFSRVTSAEIRSAARRYFTAGNRTTAYTMPPKQAAPPQGGTRR